MMARGVRAKRAAALRAFARYLVISVPSAMVPRRRLVWLALVWLALVSGIWVSAKP
jgi:hypothetical protein